MGVSRDSGGVVEEMELEGKVDSATPSMVQFIKLKTLQS